MSKPRKPIVFPEIDTSGEPENKGFLGDSWRSLYPDLRKHREWEWTATVVAYEENPRDLYRVWHYLARHPIFYYFGDERRHEAALVSTRGVHEGIEIDPAMVHKITRKAGEGRRVDRELELWVEVFPASLTCGKNTARFHDIELDTGAPTYEEALIKTAELIYDRHGNDRVKLTELWTGA